MNKQRRDGRKNGMDGWIGRTERQTDGEVGQRDRDRQTYRNRQTE